MERGRWKKSKTKNRYPRYNCARLGNLTAGVHSHSLPKGQTVAGKNAKEFKGKENGVNERLFVADLARFLENFGKAAGELGKGPEGVSGADGGKCLFGNGAGLAVNVKHFVLVDHVKHDADDSHKNVDGDNGDDDECQLPLYYKSDDKGGDKGGYGLDGDA